MKHLCVFFLLTSLAGAADFMTGQAARIVIGQQTFTSTDASAPTQNQIGAASGLAYANNTLFVADANRIQVAPIWNRVLIFNNLNGSIPSALAPIAQGATCPLCVGGFSVVLGQPDFNTSNAP